MACPPHHTALDATCQVLHAAVEIVKVNAMSKRLRIEVDIDPSLPTFVVGDQQRLRQVLLNLLFNAVKFTPQGRIVVTAALQQEFANHMRLQVGEHGLPWPYMAFHGLP